MNRPSFPARCGSPASLPRVRRAFRRALPSKLRSPIRAKWAILLLGMMMYAGSGDVVRGQTPSGPGATAGAPPASTSAVNGPRDRSGAGNRGDGRSSAQPDDPANVTFTQAPARPGVPGAPGAEVAPPVETAPPAAASAGRSPLRLASVPHMFGDFGGAGGMLIVPQNNIAFGTGPFPQVGGNDLPTAGGSRRVKIAESNVALPEDRVFFLYNHFHNALAETDALGGGQTTHLPIDRYTFGFERTFLDGCASLEVRMPFAGETDFTATNLSIDGGRVGNLAVVLKYLLCRSDESAICLGLGIDTPTGSSVDGTAGAASFHIANDSLHLLPFVGAVWMPDECWFVHAFAQVDLATNGNTVTASSGNANSKLGVLTEQNLLYLDLAAGRWLYRNAEAPWLTGLAASLELHYNTALQDADAVGGTVGAQTLFFGSAASRFDALNLTAGLTSELAHCGALRTAAVVPLRDGTNRLFDAELQVSYIWRF